MHNGSLAPAGTISLQIMRGELWSPWPQVDTQQLSTILQHGCPQSGLSPEVNRWRRSNLPNLWRGARRVLAARVAHVPTHYGALWGRVIRGDGTTVDLGLMSLRVVTDAGVAKIVALLNTTDATTGTTFKYHGFGTGTTAEAAADTALVTELTTQYAVDSTRPTGSQTNNGAAVYRSVGTLSPDSGGTIAITEHGLFSAASAGTLLDRSKFTAVNLVAGSDSLQVTYDLTVSSGG